MTDEMIGGFVLGTICGLFIGGVSCAVNQSVTRNITYNAVGCKVITAQEAGIDIEQKDKLYFRCADGKVYIR